MVDFFFFFAVFAFVFFAVFPAGAGVQSGLHMDSLTVLRIL